MRKLLFVCLFIGCSVDDAKVDGIEDYNTPLINSSFEEKDAENNECVIPMICSLQEE